MTALSYPLPAYVRLIENLRDILIVDLPTLPTNPITYTRTGVIFDADRDMRIMDVLISLHARDRHIRANVIGLAESKGHVRYWYGDKETIQFSRRALKDAANAVLFPHDKWQIDEPILAPMNDGVLDRDNLPTTDQLRAVPERYKLGLVQS